MASQAHLSNQVLSRPAKRLYAARWILAACEALSTALPQTLYRRGTQIAIDCCVASAAVLIAYNLRFDFNVPVNYAPAMWFWMIAMAIIRPAAPLLSSGYKNIWRFLRVQDVFHLAFASLPASLLLLLLRVTARQLSWAADIPRAVIALELAMFVGLASSMRGLRAASSMNIRSSFLQNYLR